MSFFYYLCAKIIDYHIVSPPRCYIMRHYILFALFALGVVITILNRIQFERKLKHTKPADYCSLYRRHNTLLICLFIYLAAEQAKPVYHALFGE